MRQLRAFCTVARLGSFTRASPQLHITQAGLSGMVRDLEEQLGTRLFDRTTRSVTVTAAGKALLPTAEHVLEELQAAASSLGRLKVASRRTLCVGATPLVASSVLPAVCRRFAVLQPDIVVKVRDLDRTQIQAQVETGELDAGFGVFLAAAAGLHRVPLVKLSLLLASASARGMPTTLSWKAVQALPLMALPVDNPVQRLIDGHLQAIGRANEDRPEFNNFHTLLAMAEGGMGCAVVPSFAELSAGRYEVRFSQLVSPKVGIDFFQITKKGREQNAALREFTGCLVDVLEATAFRRAARLPATTASADTRRSYASESPE